MTTENPICVCGHDMQQHVEFEEITPGKELKSDCAECIKENRNPPCRVFRTR